MKGIAVAGGEQTIGWFIAAVDGAKAVDHVTIGEVMCAGDDRLTGADRGQRPALPFKARSGCAMDRAGDPAAAAQLRIRRVDDGVHVRLVGDVALNALD